MLQVCQLAGRARTAPACGRRGDHTRTAPAPTQCTAYGSAGLTPGTTGAPPRTGRPRAANCVPSNCAPAGKSRRDPALQGPRDFPAARLHPAGVPVPHRPRPARTADDARQGGRARQSHGRAPGAHRYPDTPRASSYLATLPPFTRASARWRTRRRVKPSTALARAVTTWGTGFLRAAKYR